MLKWYTISGDDYEKPYNLYIVPCPDPPNGIRVSKPSVPCQKSAFQSQTKRMPFAANASHEVRAVSRESMLVPS